ncbi:MAG TPA: 50S ribosomal protein L32e [Alphaproteobacteria bacterium]|nr:50S ribosomal protein L32e [Alphaproteobacteria bacterium]
MTETKKKLLEVRKTIKDRKPEFKQQNFGKKKRISDKWKRPRGIQSKMRHRFKGYPIMVSSGWRSPVEVRGLTNKGFETVIVSNVKELEAVGHKAIIIAGTVGNKKRLEIIHAAEKLKIHVVNIKTDKFKAQIAKEKADKEKSNAEKDAKKKKTAEDSAKKAEKLEKDKAKAKETPADVDEQKAEEKKAKDDVIIHKD